MGSTAPVLVADGPELTSAPGIVARRFDDGRRLSRGRNTQPPAQYVKDSTAPTRQPDSGFHEVIERRTIRHELVEPVDDAQPLGDVSSGFPSLMDDRPHVATVAEKVGGILRL